ncbi:neuropeptide FF receptor 1-like [Acropora muricata]|uniref:neuropeptide FF receptor 1-like n=2 Tax=Acropora TaxID=6127 RepID=UPI0034E4D91B
MDSLKRTLSTSCHDVMKQLCYMRQPISQSALMVFLLIYLTALVLSVALTCTFFLSDYRFLPHRLSNNMVFSVADILEAVFLAIIVAFTIIGNGLVSVILIKNRRVLLNNRPTYNFILNMVLSDLVVGVLTMPFELVTFLLNGWTLGRVACKIVEFIEIAVLGTAVFTHALIAFDRYRCLAHPYLPKMKTRVVRNMIILSWIIPAFFSSPYLYMFDISSINSKMICTPNAIQIQWLDKLYEAVEFAVVLLMPFSVLCWCYFHVARITWQRNRSVSDTCDVTRLSVIFKNRRRVTRTAGLVAITFTVCWLPTFAVSFIRAVSGTNRIHRGHILSQIAMFGTFLNEAINPIIYCSFDRNIKEKIRLRGMCSFSEDISGSVNEAYQAEQHHTATDDLGIQMSFRNTHNNRNS